MVATSTLSHHNRLSGYDPCILPFIDVEAEECTKYVSVLVTKEKEGMEDDKGSYGASMHGSTLNVLITLWILICVSNFFLYFHLCSKLKFPNVPQCLHQLISQTYINSKNIV